MASREIEWQFEAPAPRKAVSWLRTVAKVELAPAAKQVDQYFDTSDQMLLRAGRSLRIRRTKDGFEATLKSIARAETPLRSRLEITEPLSQGDVASLSRKGRIVRQVRQIVGQASLAPLVTVTNYRRKAQTILARVPLEVSLDRFVATKGDRKAECVQRIEIEVARVNPTVEAFAADLAAACGLTPAKGAKLECAVGALGIDPVGAYPKSSLGAETTLGGLVLAIARNQRRALWANEPIARLGEDPEGVHDMRVALRRLRIALKVFGAAIPSSDALQGEIEWLGDILSAVRDIDVLLAKVESWPESKAVRRLLSKERTLAHRRLLRALDSKRYRLLLGALESLEAAGPVAQIRIDAAAADMVEHVVKKARKAADGARSGDGDALHKLRRRLKRVRYAVEFLRGIAPDESERFISRLTKLQDSLGEFQDLRVQQAWEEKLSVSLPDGALAPVAFERERRETELRKQAAKALKSAFGKPYESLHEALIERCLTSWRVAERQP